MRPALLLSTLLLGGLSAQAQPVPLPPAKTSVYVEVFGNGGLYSVNVERLLSAAFGVRLGGATWTVTDTCAATFAECEKTFVSVPLLGQVLVGRGRSKLEVGGGVLGVWERRQDPPIEAAGDGRRTMVHLTGVAGYRYQQPGGGVLFRLGLTPFLALRGGEDAYPDEGFLLSGGASIGLSF